MKPWHLCVGLAIAVEIGICLAKPDTPFRLIVPAYVGALLSIVVFALFLRHAHRSPGKFFTATALLATVLLTIGFLVSTIAQARALRDLTPQAKQQLMQATSENAQFMRLGDDATLLRYGAGNLSGSNDFVYAPGYHSSAAIPRALSSKYIGGGWFVCALSRQTKVLITTRPAFR